MTPTRLPKGYNVQPFEAPRFAEQDDVNASADTLDSADLAAFIRGVAADQVAKYPQYDRKFDEATDWELVRFRRAVVTKGGCRFARGDFAIRARVSLSVDDDDPAFKSVWSVRGAISCVVPADAFKAVER